MCDVSQLEFRGTLRDNLSFHRLHTSSFGFSSAGDGGVGVESAIQLGNSSFPSILCVYELAALRKSLFLPAMPTYYCGMEASSGSGSS